MFITISQIRCKIKGEENKWDHTVNSTEVQKVFNLHKLIKVEIHKLLLFNEDSTTRNEWYTQMFDRFKNNLRTCLTNFIKYMFKF